MAKFNLRIFYFQFVRTTLSIRGAAPSRRRNALVWCLYALNIRTQEQPHSIPVHVISLKVFLTPQFLHQND